VEGRVGSEGCNLYAMHNTDSELVGTGATGERMVPSGLVYGGTQDEDDRPLLPEDLFYGPTLEQRPWQRPWVPTTPYRS